MVTNEKAPMGAKAEKTATTIFEFGKYTKKSSLQRYIWNKNNVRTWMMQF